MFGAIKLTQHPDIDQYKYSGYVIGVDRKEFFSLGDEAGKSFIIFGVDMSSSSHIDKKKKYILILGKDPTKKLQKNCIQSTLLKIMRNFVLAYIIME